MLANKQNRFHIHARDQQPTTRQSVDNYVVSKSVSWIVNSYCACYRLRCECTRRVASSTVPHLRLPSPGDSNTGDIALMLYADAFCRCRARFRAPWLPDRSRAAPHGPLFSYSISSSAGGVENPLPQRNKTEIKQLQMHCSHLLTSIAEDADSGPSSISFPFPSQQAP